MRKGRLLLHAALAFTAANALVAQPATPAKEPWVRPPGMTDRAWNAMLDALKRTVKANQPVAFYARTLDQDGQPVPGVELILDLSFVDTARVLSPRFLETEAGNEIATKRIVLNSDSNGWLQVTGENGTGLSVESVSKPGHLWERPGHMGTLSFEANNRRNWYKEMLPASDQKTGYTFHLWRKGPTEPLVSVNWRIDNYQQHPDKSWITNYVANLFTGESRGAEDAKANWDIALRWSREPAVGMAGRFLVCFELAVRDGGLCETDNYYPYLAPQTGYSPVYRFADDPRDPSSEKWTKNLYVRARSGRLFGGFQVQFDGTVRFKGYLNPSGSRVLEPDPAKLITDPAEIRRLDEATRVK